MRGRQFGFIALLCATWITARMGAISLMSHGPEHISFAAKSLRVSTGTSMRHTTRPARRVFPRQEGCCPIASATRARSRLVAYDQHIEFDTRSTFDLATLPAQRQFAKIALQPPRKQQTRDIKRPSRLDVYAYSFWRSGGPNPAPLGSGQYGGGQSAVIAAYHLLHFETDAVTPRLSVIGRAALAHGDSSDRELAAGLRWRPSERLPLYVTAEHRFRHARPDAVAVYLAGGKSGVALPMDFKLEGYVQAGFVSGKSGGTFADFNARADRQLGRIGKAPISSGVGIWGGGQGGAGRVDVGPSLRTDVSIGQAQIRVAADWRFRVAGSATPRNGPAFTLSTSF